MRTIGCAAMLLCLGMLSGSLSAEVPQVVFLAPDRCYFFAENFYTGVDFLAIVKTGEYARIDREHMFTEEYDRGRWSQEKDGVVSLRSNRRFRDVSFGSLSLGFYGDDSPDHVIPRVKAALRDLLQKHPAGKDFKVEDVPRNRGLIIDAETELVKKRVPRGDIAGMLSALEQFERSNDQNEFRFIPLSYKGRVFIEWQNEGTPLQRDRKQLMEQIDKSAAGEFPDFTMVGIAQDEFQQEAATTQPFIYHPEVNRDAQNPEAEQRAADITAQCS